MECDNLRKECCTFYENIKRCADESIQRFSGNDRDTILRGLQEAVEHVCKIETSIESALEILDSMDHEIGRSDKLQGKNLTEVLRKKLAGKEKEDPSRLTSLEDYQAYIESAFNKLEGQSMIVQCSENVICPISKKPIVHPVAIRFCNHKLDKAPALELLQSKPKQRCPQMGCDKYFTKDDLVDLE